MCAEDEDPTKAAEEIGMSGGDRSAHSFEEMFPLVYTELRKIARRLFFSESAGHTLQPTALVHEAYLKLVDQKRADVKSRTHVIAVGAQAMRRLLVDHARKRGAAKRGSKQKNLDLMDVLDSAADHELNLDHACKIACHGFTVRARVEQDNQTRPCAT